MKRKEKKNAVKIYGIRNHLLARKRIPASGMIRDITSLILKEVCSDIATEPLLQPLLRKEFSYKTAKVEEEARVDISEEDSETEDKKIFLRYKYIQPVITVLFGGCGGGGGGGVGSNSSCISSSKNGKCSSNIKKNIVAVMLVRATAVV